MRNKVAISIWRNRVSPVMDSAGQLMVIDYEDERETNRSIVNLPDLDLIYKSEFLKNQGISLLICGAISKQMHQILTASHIEVIPFIRGSIRKVLNAYIRGELQEDHFFLPGCRNNTLGPRCNRRRKRGKY